MNIKVCGITSMKQLQQLDGLDIDFVGLNFFKQSPRYVGNKINTEELEGADLDIRKVGVFVNADYDEIMKTSEKFDLDIVQLHGDESVQLCSKLSSQIELIKAFAIEPGTTSIDHRLKEYDEVCDYYLFDSVSSNGFGGTGEQFDWEMLASCKIEKPFFIAGGITNADALKIRHFKHPDFFGIDINSGFEKEPGIKDMGKILQLKQALK
jgi:phosphoribosylanthranilate isomerase